MMNQPLTERPGSPAALWSQMAAPWRAAAERLGFRFLDRSLSNAGAEAYTCCDFLVHPDGTFLDLVGGIVESRPRPPGAHGVRFAQLRSWLESEGDIAEAFTVAPVDRGAEAPGCLPLLMRGLVRPILDRLLPEHLQPVRLSAPDDLAHALARHRDLRGQRPGRVLRPGSDPLASRERWSQR